MYLHVQSLRNQKRHGFVPKTTHECTIELCSTNGTPESDRVLETGEIDQELESMASAIGVYIPVRRFLFCFVATIP